MDRSICQNPENSIPRRVNFTLNQKRPGCGRVPSNGIQTLTNAALLTYEYVTSPPNTGWGKERPNPITLESSILIDAIKAKDKNGCTDLPYSS